MYSFGNRLDTAVIDEPFYGYYLKNTEAANYHPSAEETMNSMSCDADEVMSELLSFNQKPIYFIKNMPHHLPEPPKKFLSELQHVILLRKPEDMIRSFSKVIPNPKLSDFGYLDQLKLVKQLHHENLPFFLLESEEVLANPACRLSRLCKDLCIPFSERMLSWPKGARKEDGIWAKHWYANVHKSTTFRTSAKQAKSPLNEKQQLILKELDQLYGKIKSIFNQAK